MLILDHVTLDISNKPATVAIETIDYERTRLELMGASSVRFDMIWLDAFTAVPGLTYLRDETDEERDRRIRVEMECERLVKMIGVL